MALYYADICIHLYGTTSLRKAWPVLFIARGFVSISLTRFIWLCMFNSNASNIYAALLKTRPVANVKHNLDSHTGLDWPINRYCIRLGTRMLAARCMGSTNQLARESQTPKGPIMAIVINFRRKLASGNHRTLKVSSDATPDEWDDVKDRSIAQTLSEGKGAIRVLIRLGLKTEAEDLQADAVEELEAAWAKAATATARSVAQAAMAMKAMRTADRARAGVSASNGGGKLK